MVALATLCRSALVSSQLEEFLDSMANECDEKTLRSIKAKEIFYQVCIVAMATHVTRLSHDVLCSQSGVSRAGNPVFYLVTRKFRSVEGVG